MEKAPIVVEKFADNGEYSHYNLIDQDTGELLWSEAPEEEVQQVKSCSLGDVSKAERSVCVNWGNYLECNLWKGFINGCQDCYLDKRK